MVAKSLRPSRIVLSKSLQSEIETHAYSDLDFELGGMLFGKAGPSKTEILGFVPALKASKDQVSLTFTHEVWEAILQEGAEKFPDYGIVGWYHTHPAFGIFLSDYDSFIQENFFSAKGQLALVIDPIAGSLGWFDLDAKKKVRRLAIEEAITGPKEKPKNPPAQLSSSRRKHKPVQLFAATILAAGFGLLAGFGLSAANSPTDLTAGLAQREAVIDGLLLRNGELETFLAEAQSKIAEAGTPGVLRFVIAEEQ
jgi:proteasome lid subunit RPN8/RPN11